MFHAHVAIIKNKHGKISHIGLDEYHKERFVRGKAEGWELLEEIKNDAPELKVDDLKEMYDEELYELVKSYGISPPVKDRATNMVLVDLIRKYREKKYGQKVLAEAQKKRVLGNIEAYESKAKVDEKVQEDLKWNEVQTRALSIADAKKLDRPKKRDMATLLRFIEDNK